MSARDEIRGLSAALRTLHGRLLAATRRGFEKLHGRVDSSGELLQLAINDPLFAWLHPLSECIVELDELAAGEAADEATVAAARGAVARLLDADSAFRASYHVYLQSDPDAVLAHGAVRRLVGPAGREV
jgi:hypothetical protein